MTDLKRNENDGKEVFMLLPGIIREKNWGHQPDRLLEEIMRITTALLVSLIVINSCSASETLTNESLRRVFPEYPEIEIFQTDFLDFFSYNADIEKRNTLANSGKYVLNHDFDDDGLEEVVVTGLISREPVDGRYQAFVAVLSAISGEYETLFFKKIYKTMGKPNTIQNLSLGINDTEEVFISFKYETGYMAFIRDEEGYSVELVR